MGNVQGDKKLKIPAIKASKVRATIPESGRLGLGWKGLRGADFATVDCLSSEGDIEGFEKAVLVLAKAAVVASITAGWVVLIHRNPTSGAGSSALEYCR